MASSLRQRPVSSPHTEASSSGQPPPLDEQEQNHIVDSLRRDYERYTASMSTFISYGCAVASAASLLAPVLLLHLDDSAHHTSATSLVWLMLHVPYACVLHAIAACAARGLHFPPRIPFFEGNDAGSSSKRNLSQRDENIMLIEGGLGSIVPICILTLLSAKSAGVIWDDAALVSMWTLAIGNVLTAGAVIWFRWDIRSTKRDLSELDSCRYRFKSL